MALLRAASQGDIQSIHKNRLSPMFKGKILFIYYPTVFAPIYSDKHLKFFLAELDVTGSFKKNTDMQRALMDYRSIWPELVSQPVPLYMRFLYDTFGYPQDDKQKNGSPAKMLLLDDALKGAQFIEQFPAMPKISSETIEKLGKTNHEKQQKELKRIGDRGENLVINLERKRLIQAGRPDLAKRVRHVSEETDIEGYDILSFDLDGTFRYIEVKATSAVNLSRGFYISSNEYQKSQTLRNYYIYFVFSALSRNAKIYPVKHPELKGSDFELRSVTYHVTLKAKG